MQRTYLVIQIMDNRTNLLNRFLHIWKRGLMKICFSFEDMNAPETNFQHQFNTLADGRVINNCRINANFFLHAALIISKNMKKHSAPLHHQIRHPGARF